MPEVRTNAAAVAAALGRREQEILGSLPGAVRNAALLVETRIKANASLPASGPPGPRAITGDYRASWNTQPQEHSRDQVAYRVGTDRPQGRRLEFGFVGADALGRVYNQPPYPHVAPAVDAMGPSVRDMILKTMRSA